MRAGSRDSINELEEHYETNKPRNRESRTKPIPTESSVAIRLRLPRESYDQMRDLVKNRRATKEDIFLRGLQAYCNQ